ncbi:hypothetical protein HZS_5937 [Henneguya salminicola]|nr:hypothetical protein HZS_5937 [Henneguya salminicola]
MGIKGLTKFLIKNAPSSIRNVDIANYFGKIIAIDAFLIIYQFLTSARDNSSALSNTQGDDTAYCVIIIILVILWEFYTEQHECWKIISNLCINVALLCRFVFDGKPPKEKEDELRKRSENREKTQIEIDKAKINGDLKLVDSLSKRMVKINENHISSCKKLLDLLGVPYLVAIADAEAQCAHLVQDGHAYAVATEDTDALTFGANFLIRHFSPNDKSKQMQQIDLDKIYQELDINKEQRFTLPKRFDFEGARKIFLNKTDCSEIKLKWKKPDLEGLSKYLSDENNFNATRIETCIQRLKKTKNVSNQSTMDNFFSRKRPKPTLAEEIDPKKSKHLS